MKAALLYSRALSLRLTGETLPRDRRRTNHRSQVLYQRSGRAFLLFFAFFSAYYTCGAMALFTVSSPYFYFFGVPTVFALVYLSCHCEYWRSESRHKTRRQRAPHSRRQRSVRAAFGLPPKRSRIVFPSGVKRKNRAVRAITAQDRS